MKLKVVLIFLFLFVEKCLCSTKSCNTTEEQFLNGTFTITGPCPSVIIAPVGKTVSYKCDYEDMRVGNDLAIWNISGFVDSPFLEGDGLKYGISITSQSQNINNILMGDTTLDIEVREQYLMETVNIQCGLCSGSVCYTNDPLQENIISDPVILVAFSKFYTLMHY